MIILLKRLGSWTRKNFEEGELSIGKVFVFWEQQFVKIFFGDENPIGATIE